MAVHCKTPHTKVIGGSVNSQRPEVVSSTTNPLAIKKQNKQNKTKIQSKESTR